MAIDTKNTNFSNISGVSTTSHEVGKTNKKPEAKPEGTANTTTYSNQVKPEAPKIGSGLSSIQTRFKNAVSEVTKVQGEMKAKDAGTFQILTVAMDILNKGKAEFEKNYKIDGVIDEVDSNSQPREALAGLIGDVGVALGDEALGSAEDVSLTEAAKKLFS